jgi:hypothetical protein
MIYFYCKKPYSTSKADLNRMIKFKSTSSSALFIKNTGVVKLFSFLSINASKRLCFNKYY